MENKIPAPLPVFTPIPAGTFLQGASPEDVERAVDLRASWMQEASTRRQMMEKETPQREVTITKGFDLATTPVTVGQFRAFVEAAGYETESQHNNRGGAFYDKGTFRESMDYTWETPLPDYTANDLEPVTQVTYNDAWAYCKWLGAVTNSVCRLPTEAEWEYASLGKDREGYGMGADFLDPIAIHSAQDVENAASRRANQYGLFDMLGNVWEWCSDYASEGWETAEPVMDPKGPTIGGARIRRGGSFSSPLNQLRSSYRKWSPPIYRGRIVGFRVLREKTS